MSYRVKENPKSVAWGAVIATFMLFVGIVYACSVSSSVIDAYAEGNSDGALDAGSCVTTIYFTNDVHGNFGYAQKTNGMSYATAKALKDKGNTGDNKAYLVDAGDHVSGSSYTNIDQGQSILEIMTDTGYDFRVPGNHEFDYGSDTFFEMIAKSAQYYACNFYNGSPIQRGSNLLESYKVVDGANGEKIAFIGIMTPETITASAPGYFQDNDGNWKMYIDSVNTVTSIYDQLNATVRDVKETYGQNTICIAVGHLGNEASSVSTGIDSTTVIQHSSGLSAFIDGHSHTIENTTVTDADGKTVPLLQAASGIDANNSTETTGINRIGALTIAADGAITGTILSATDGEYSFVTPDEEVQLEENYLIAAVDTILSEEVSTNNIEFASSAKEIQRGKTNNLAELVADSMYYYANTYADSNGVIWECDAAIVNGGAIRATLGTGTNTFKSFLDVLPFINKLVVAEVTGQQILDALEYGAKDTPGGTFGGFMQVSGITYTINSNITSTVQTLEGFWVGPPTGAYKVQNVQIYDKAEKKYKDIELTKTYKLAGYNYNVGNYGDGFLMFVGSEKHEDYNDLITVQILGKYIKDFAKTEAEAIPEISTANSPLSTNEGFSIAYEKKDGSGRISIGAQFIQKVDTTGCALAGAKLTLLDANGSEVKTWTSTVGFESFTLESGTYTLREDAAPHGYKQAESIVFTVAGDGKVSIDGQELANNTIKIIGEAENGSNTPGASISTTPNTGDTAGVFAFGAALLAVGAAAVAYSLRRRNS